MGVVSAAPAVLPFPLQGCSGAPAESLAEDLFVPPLPGASPGPDWPASPEGEDHPFAWVAEMVRRTSP